MGQFTPGPVLTTSTYIGYQLHGLSGALVATTCIFLPSFIFVMILSPLVPKLRKSVWAAAFLDSVNAAALGLMISVTVKLTFTSLYVDDWRPYVILALSALAFLYYKVNVVYLIAGAGLIGFLLSFI